MAEHCQTCSHFVPGAQMSSRYPPLGEGWGICWLGTSISGKPDTSQTTAYAEDSEHYMAWLNVHEEFGCVQYSSE
jgi:hypothetical protein